ncbi:MAG: HD-GYP domain-containing protein [Angelakisella sp.]
MFKRSDRNSRSNTMGSVRTSASNDKSYGDLVKIDASNFAEGMYVGTGVYVKYNNNYLLLFQNTVLSQEHVGKINDFEISGGSIYVGSSAYEKIVTQYKHFSSSQQSRLKHDYDNLKNNVAAAFLDIKLNNSVSLQTIDKIAADIEHQVNTVEPSLLIQCITAIRSVDEYLYIHSVNVSLLNGLMAKWLDLNPVQTEELINVGVLHDIGKIKIDLGILNKPSKLTNDEFDIIKMHPVYSYETLIASGMKNQRVLAAARGHHEKLNGRGYPDGLSGDQIDLYSRITSISDIYDAMVADRVYKEPVSPFDVLEQFSNDKFSNLDIQLVNTFLDKMTLDLVGKKVLLSNGDVGLVLYIERANLAYPIVRVDDCTIMTNENLKCISLCDDLV